MSKPINPDARSLEEAFFAKENAKLLERLRQSAEHAERRKALHDVAPNADEATIDRLLELGIGPETVLAMTLVPLTVVAWADGSIDQRERLAVLRAAAERGVRPGSAGHQLLELWLTRKPGPELRDAWKRYVESTWGSLGEDERHSMREQILGLARGVAEAAGGFLGIGSISAGERAALDEIERSLP